MPETRGGRLSSASASRLTSHVMWFCKASFTFLSTFYSYLLFRTQSIVTKARRSESTSESSRNSLLASLFVHHTHFVASRFLLYTSKDSRSGRFMGSTPFVRLALHSGVLESPHLLSCLIWPKFHKEEAKLPTQRHR